MKNLKIIIVTIVIIATFLSILYLGYIAEQMERYTISRSDGEKCYVIFTLTSGRLSDGKNLDDLLAYTQKSLKNAGYDAFIIDDDKNLEEKLRSSMKNNKKYIFIDINTTKLLASSNSIVLRIGNNNNPKYNENFEYAKLIKESIKEIKTTIISDKISNYNQDIAFKALRIEISENINYEDAEDCILRVLKPVIQ